MRTTRLLVALAAIALQLAPAGLAQNSSGSTQPSSVSVPAGNRGRTGLALSDRNPTSGISGRRALYVAANRSMYARSHRALVIPSPQTTSEQLAALAADMAIMCRLLETKLLIPYVASWRSSGLSLPWSARGERSSLFASDGDRAGSFYVADYGFVFTLTVDFPLVAPADANEAAKPQDQGDPLWTQVKRQMAGADGSATATADAAGPPYDPAKVDQFVAGLVQSLRHAANIRHMKPNEWITVVVRSTTPHAGTSPMARTSAAAYGQQIVANVRAQARGLPSSGTILTVRAHKADIDAFANDELSAEQFRQRVERATY